MNNLKHPAALLGIATIVLVFFGIGLKANGYRSGDYVLIISAFVGAIQWIWSIINVIQRHDMKPFQKRFWLIIVIAAPVAGALLFFTLHQTAGKITT